MPDDANRRKAAQSDDEYDHFDIYEQMSTCLEATAFEILHANKITVSREPIAPPESDENEDIQWGVDGWHADKGGCSILGSRGWDEDKAQCWAAMYAYLWLKGVPFDLAQEFSYAYVDFRSRRRVI